MPSQESWIRAGFECSYSLLELHLLIFDIPGSRPGAKIEDLLWFHILPGPCQMASVEPGVAVLKHSWSETSVYLTLLCLATPSGEQDTGNIGDAAFLSH